MTLIRVDECISWRIVAALRALGLPNGIELETPHEREQIGLVDVDWIEDFAARGGRLFISGDASMRSNHLERAALEASGLIAVFPSSKRWFDQLRKWAQAAYLTVWFPTIVRLAEEADAGTHHRLPPTFSGEFDSVEQMIPLSEIEATRERKARDREAAREAKNT